MQVLRAARVTASRCSSVRARSTMRARRLVSTPSVAATPVSRNTGATADWIRRAISIGSEAVTGALAAGQYCGAVHAAVRSFNNTLGTPPTPMKPSHLQPVEPAAPADTDGVSLPAWIYRDAEFFEREQQAIFRSSWQLVCHLSDVTAPGGLPHLRVRRRIGSGAARRGRRGAGISQCLPAPRVAPARRAARPLRTAHHLPIPRLDLCPRRTPDRRAAARQLHRAGQRAPRAPAARARGVHGLHFRALAPGLPSVRDMRRRTRTSSRPTAWRSWCRSGASRCGRGR